MTLGNLRKFGKEFVSKNSHAVEKDEKSISTMIILRLNKAPKKIKKKRFIEVKMIKKIYIRSS